MSEPSSFQPAIDALESLPTALKAVRLSRSASLRRVASEVGVSFSTITRIESGEDCTVGNALAVLRWLANPPAPALTAEVSRKLIAEPDEEPTIRVWTCDECGTRSSWTDGWTWYGSWRQVELTGQPEAVLCSPDCRKAHAERNARDPEVQ